MNAVMGAGWGAPNNRLVNSTLSGYSPPGPFPPSSGLSVQINCQPSELQYHIDCYASASGGTGGGYEYTWLTGSSFGEYTTMQCPYSGSMYSWADVYVTVLDSGGSGTTHWQSVQCLSSP